ncbi:DUF317 domain-containing protein [Embleya sp. NBC_00896]|uniref:DUF317 domain-containing protein n=1 Tax=Embleya sp. NBC_00896 TaxID=2975961 RepID=UPI002F9129DC|nr:DUF317 domain-containing protein [Embleya sp. NBC_00896]
MTRQRLPHIPVPVHPAGAGEQTPENLLGILGWPITTDTADELVATSPNGKVSVTYLSTCDRSDSEGVLWRITADLDPGRSLWKVEFGPQAAGELVAHFFDALANGYKDDVDRRRAYLEANGLPTRPVDLPAAFAGHVGRSWRREPSRGEIDFLQDDRGPVRVDRRDTRAYYLKYTVFALRCPDGIVVAIGAVEGEADGPELHIPDDGFTPMVVEVWAVDAHEAMAIVQAADQPESPTRLWRVIGVENDNCDFHPLVVIEGDDTIDADYTEMAGIEVDTWPYSDVAEATSPTQAVASVVETFNASLRD